MAIDKYYLNLAGEYRTAAELLKRELFATITYGNKKGADIYAIGPNRRTAVVEVKASNSQRFVTGFYQKYTNIQRLVPAVFPNGATTAINQNAASAKIDGAEGEFTFIPNRLATSMCPAS